MLNHFTFAKFKFTLRALEEIVLPAYKGAVLRGGFGYAFKKIVCVQRTNKECSECMLKNKCVYDYIFETSPPADTEVLKLYNAVPHPFIIEPPLSGERSIKQGGKISFHLILVGKAVDYLPYFIFTFNELGKQGMGKNRSKFVLEEVGSVGMDDGYETIYTSEDEVLQNNGILMEASRLAPSGGQNARTQIEIEFLTPFRTRFEGKITGKIEFHVIFRSLLRRTSSLSYFHCGKMMECDYKQYIEDAEQISTVSNNMQWFDWERYSTRQKQRMDLGGVIGKAKFEGALAPFLQILRLGEYIHAGKGTSFGLGKYRLTIMNNDETTPSKQHGGQGYHR